jgi:hypothetical protein
MSHPGLLKGLLQLVQHPGILFDEAPDLEHMIYTRNIEPPGAAHKATDVYQDRLVGDPINIYAALDLIVFEVMR